MPFLDTENCLVSAWVPDESIQKLVNMLGPGPHLISSMMEVFQGYDIMLVKMAEDLNIEIKNTAYHMLFHIRYRMWIDMPGKKFTQR